MNLLFLIICFSAFFLIYVYTENKLITVKRYRVKCGKKLKIVQISDIHKKRNEVQLCSRVRQLNPDIVFLTGDLVSRSEKDYSHLDYLTQKLSEICPVYACPGNHELDLSDSNHNSYRQIMQKNGVDYLENRQTVFEKDGTEIKIAGTCLKSGVYKNPDGGYSDLEKFTAAELESTFGKNDGFTILLAHNPLCFDAYAQWGADLVFSGHVHGGAVRLPVLGGLLSPERKFFPRYSKGVYTSGKTQMIVSGGIGKLRVFNPPEIVYCELE